MDGAPPMTPITPTQIDLNDHIRQMKIQENKILSEMSGNFVSVTNVSDLLKPDKIRPLNNSAVKPDSGTVFVQDRDYAHMDPHAVLSLYCHVRNSGQVISFQSKRMVFRQRNVRI